MILTGKAKEDFIKTKIGNEISLFESMLPIYSNALIVEWFDSVGIYIFIDSVKSYKERFWRFHIAMNDLDRNIREEFYMDNRSEITYKAIKKANEIYNEKYSISQ